MRRGVVDVGEGKEDVEMATKLLWLLAHVSRTLTITNAWLTAS